MDYGIVISRERQWPIERYPGNTVGNRTLVFTIMTNLSGNGVSLSGQQWSDRNTAIPHPFKSNNHAPLCTRHAIRIYWECNKVYSGAWLRQFGPSELR